MKPKPVVIVPGFYIVTPDPDAKGVTHVRFARMQSDAENFWREVYRDYGVESRIVDTDGNVIHAGVA